MDETILSDFVKSEIVKVLPKLLWVESGFQTLGANAFAGPEDKLTRINVTSAPSVITEGDTKSLVDYNKESDVVRVAKLANIFTISEEAYLGNKGALIVDQLLTQITAQWPTAVVAAVVNQTDPATGNPISKFSTLPTIADDSPSVPYTYVGNPEANTLDRLIRQQNGYDSHYTGLALSPAGADMLSFKENQYGDAKYPDISTFQRLNTITNKGVALKGWGTQYDAAANGDADNDILGILGRFNQMSLRVGAPRIKFGTQGSVGVGAAEINLFTSNTVAVLVEAPLEFLYFTEDFKTIKKTA